MATATRFIKAELVVVGVYAAAIIVYEFQGGSSDLAADGPTPQLVFLLDLTSYAVLILIMLHTLPYLSALAQGLDGPAISGSAIVSAEASPPGDSAIWQRELRDATIKGLAHSSLYDDPVVVSRVLLHALPPETRASPQAR